MNLKNTNPRKLVYTEKNGFQLDYALCRSYNIFPGDVVDMIRLEVGDYSSRVFIEGKKRGINAAVFDELKE